MKYTLIALIYLSFVSFSFKAQEGNMHFDNKSYVAGEMLVQIVASANLERITDRAPQAFDLKVAEELSRPMRIWLVTFDAQAVSASKIQFWLYSQKEVSVADYNYHVQMRSTIPGDPSFGSQWHHYNTGGTGGTLDADIDSDLAWDITQGGKTATNHDIVVCMVEGSGGNLNHQDLTQNRWVNQYEIDGNNIDDDGNGYIDDYNGWNTGSNNDDTGTGGHGTNCLGMIGARGNNGLNVVGANWDVKLMVLNMGGGLTQSSVVQAYTYPLVLRQQWNQSGGTQGALVVATSSSWGIDGANPNSYPLWCQFYDTLGHYGILNVGATTNQELDVDVVGDMPTGCTSDYMIGVGRTDKDDNTAGGYGDQTINFGAPGISVVTTSGTTSITTTTGTSFACPLTAGVIGLAYSVPCNDFMDLVISDPKAGADAVLAALTAGVDAKPQLTSRFITGGRLNSRNTLDELINATCNVTICDMDPGETVVQPTCPGPTGGSITLNVTGGSPGYTFDWGLNGGNVNSLSGLDPGSYFVSITDNSGCDTLINYIIDYSVDLQVSINATNVSCNGAADGSATAVATGSTGYNYQWQGGPATDVYSPLVPGSYFVDVTDINGCTASSSVVISEPDVAVSSFTYSTNFLAVTFSNASQGGPSEWDFGDGSPVSTMFNTSHIYASPGTYTVCLSIFGACDTATTCQDVIVTQNNASVIDLENENILIYPNPANDVLNFIIANPELRSVELLDVLGNIVLNKVELAENTQIDCSGLSNGTYFFRIRDEQGTTVVIDKIMINR
jgi:PKD repeat protein